MSQQVVHTTVVVHDQGCCGPKGRVQWVAGYNLVVGIICLIWGAVWASYGYNNREAGALGGLQIVFAILLISAGIVLLVGLHRRLRIFFTVWLMLIGLYILICVAYLIYNIVIVAQYHLGSSFAGSLAMGIIFILIQALCIVAVVQYRNFIA